jgi:acetylornithine/succinyldiaminopimelate/putrescine aminotransferase
MMEKEKTCAIAAARAAGDIIRTSTARTGSHELGSAFLAELGPLLILKPTTRTVHGCGLLTCLLTLL